MSSQNTQNKPAFRDCTGFDFTALSNYVPPERTLQDDSRSWNNALSTFYTAGQTLLSQEGSRRDKPQEMEFARVRDEEMSDELHDALRAVLCMADIMPEWAQETAPLVAAHGATAFFRLSTITTRRGCFDVAYVKNNTLYTL